jgi:hypothetical protein
MEKLKRKAPKSQEGEDSSLKKRERPIEKRDDARTESEDYYNVNSSKK